MTTASCSSRSPETLCLCARVDVTGREGAQPYAAKDVPFVDAPWGKSNTAILDQVLQPTAGILLQGHVRVASTPVISKQAGRRQVL